MADQNVVDPHDPVMTGENSFIRLSTDGGKTILDRTSHWRVLWSPAGQGHVLFMESSLSKGVKVYSDNPAVARFLQRTIEVYLHKPFSDESLPVIDAEFARHGNSLSCMEERISSAEDEIIMTWWDFIDPFILTMAPGTMNRPIGVYSTFIPAKSAQLAVNDRAATAKVFPMERFGKPASSCVLAWSESWTKPRS